MRRGLVVAIDGPAGAGKSSTARALAAHLGLPYLDSGAIYRGLALAWLRSGQAEDAPVESVLRTHPVEVGLEGKEPQIFVAGEPAGEELRSGRTGLLASRLAMRPDVRSFVAERLRKLAAIRGAVVEGRDMGTVVFPDADFKFFLTADLAERARRRYRELLARGERAEIEAVREEIEERDERDTTRAVSPLRKAEDAVLVDTTGLSFDEQVAVLLDLVRGRGRPLGSRLYRLSKGVLRFVLFGLLRMKSEGLEHLPRGAFILASNHRSNLDPPCIGTAVPGAIWYFAKQELFSRPVLGWLIRRLNAIPVRRGRYDRRAIEGALRVLRTGRPLLLFPEGTRRKRPGLGRPRGGVALLARRAGVPVVPAWIEGTGSLRPGAIRVRFGPALQFPAGGDESADEAFAASVMERIAVLGGVEPPARDEA